MNMSIRILIRMSILIPTAMSTAMKRNIPTAMSPRHIPAARDARLTAGTMAMITAMKFLKHRIR